MREGTARPGSPNVTIDETTGPLGRLRALATGIALHPFIVWLGRVLLCAVFIQAPVEHAIDFPAFLKEVAGEVPQALVLATAIATLVVQAIGSALVCLTRRWAWLGAALLGGFTFFVAFVAHDFWNFTGEKRGSELSIFLEHMGLVGGFVLVGYWSLLPVRGAGPPARN